MTYRGKVTRKYSGEALSHIPVSDGRNTTFTDENGKFKLEGWDRARVIHVGVLTHGHDDWFIHINSHYEEQFDFCIDPVESEKDFCFLHTSDTEIVGRRDVEWIDFMREQVCKEKPAFFLNTGDLCYADGLARHYLLMNRETVWCPVRYAIGNHDFVGKAYGEELYEHYYGPTWYSFDCGDIHFVTMSIMYGDRSSGYQPSDQWLWLKEDLEKCANGKKLVVLGHQMCYWDEKEYKIELDDCTLDLKANGLIAWVFGHLHTNVLHDNHGVYDICTSRPDSGGIDSSYAGIRKIAFHGDKLSSQMIFTCEEQEGDAPIWKTKLDGNIEFCVPQLREDFIYVATCSDGTEKNCGIYKLSKADGAVQWFFPTENGIKGNLCIDGNRIYAQDTAAVTYCIDIDGHEIFRIQSPAPYFRYTRLGVCIAKDVLLTGHVHILCAYHKLTGEKLWERRYEHSSNTPAGIIYDEVNERFIVPNHWYGMNVLDCNTGETAWAKGDDATWFRTATPLILGNSIFAAGNDTLAEYDLYTGELKNNAKVDMQVCVSGAPAYDGHLLYYPTANRGVAAVDKETLQPRCFYACGKAKLYTAPYLYGDVQMVEGSPIISGDRLIFTANDGGLYIYNKDTAELICRKDIGSPSLVSPLVCEDCVICADFFGNIKCYAL